MYKLKCPHCGIKLGNFLYADACPHCHEELKHNTRPLVSVIKKDSQKPKLWPVRLFFRIVRFVES
jgi:predicted amidophosphoribosyltransferase